MVATSAKPGEITERLREISQGDRSAMDSLIPIVEAELRRQAHAYLRRERRNHTLQTTALVNEAYLKLIDQRSVNWENRAHFFAISATLMRRILVKYARDRNRLKRGGGVQTVQLNEEIDVPEKARNVDIIALDQLLNRLRELDERQSRLVELKYFAGLTIKEISEVMRISPATIKREWDFARAWLRVRLEEIG
ncbi:MAG: RNA polymerase subunit sigma-70 [Acidobacteria bacterium]|nr:MAG: RNA polymerase subunit sigma-70 [Acidobacteriota bacterium]REJ99279.1 MAG: RNA polymerase subunit sigma-70 [Acidobacteriota bacterium]REK16000.1 MAG: RNA polymerase subunit sigma-70 [Acidobacteriota bacterium]REK43681.1 MAG: RNA polymerase subunit sigma-70 [Acidobacteriota bacterium]